MYNDIFISYRNDFEGKAIGRTLKTLLEKNNYMVYFNPDEQTGEYFPEELRTAVLNCKDFLLIITKGCLERLLENKTKDWIREEILMAHQNKKHFIPILVNGVNLPDDENMWPEALRFLFYMNYLEFPADPDRFAIPPFRALEQKLISRPERGDNFRDAFNSNAQYDVIAEFKRMLEDARAGDTDALYELAINYYYGFADENGCSQRNYQKAYDCFKKLAETDNPHKLFAINMIGHMYYRGTIPHEGQSYEESLKRHLYAADTLEGAAQHAAYMLSIGSGCSFDYDQTVEYYKKIIKNGDNSAKYNLAQFFCDYGEYAKAADLYQSLYSSFPDAAVQLGKLYKRGVLTRPPKPDYFMAAYFFQYAIQSGKCGAEPYYELGKLYFNPTGPFTKDFKLAQDNFLIAADMGHIDSQYMLGYMFDAGHVEHNIEKAIHYHELAAKQGHMMSAAALVTLYQQPEHVNYHRALKYAEIAASSGMSMGEYLYANLLFFGRGCEANMNEAFKYYKRSYEHGFVQSKIMMEKISEILNANRH